MRIIARSYAGDNDKARIVSLATAHPERHLHVHDLPYRLSSPALDNAQNACLWEDGRGALAGFAIWQPAFKMLDIGCHPQAPAQELFCQIIDWVEAYFERQVQESGQKQTCWVKARTSDAAWIAMLERRGFRRCPWSVAHKECDLEPAPEHPSVPEGFRLRPVADEAEIDACVALHKAVFTRVGMTPAWRQRMMRMPTYQAGLDIIAEAPEGELAAFCLGWIGREAGETIGQIEPLGTHPDFRKRGLAQAALRDVLHRMRAMGVRRAIVELWDDNHAALQFYRSVGFRQTDTLHAYGREFS